MRFCSTHIDPFVYEVLVVQLVVLWDVVLGELCQLQHLRHDLLLLERVGHIHQQRHNTVSTILVLLGLGKLNQGLEKRCVFCFQQ